MNLTLTDRFSVEPFVTYGRRSSPAFDSAAAVVETQRTEGMYGVVVHQRLRSTTRSGFHAYLSYGLNGMHYKVTSPATRSQTVGMLFPSVGFGTRKSLGDHLAVRADTDLVTDFMMPVGVRASVGVVVPLGANK